jgi:nitrogen-specific signal transduction histidine kinase
MDRQLMEQALLNVVKNAMEAVEMGASDDSGLPSCWRARTAACGYR